MAFAFSVLGTGRSPPNTCSGVDLKPHYCEGDARLFLADSLLQLGLKRKAIEQWQLVAAMAPQYPGYEAVSEEAKRKLGEHA